MGTIYLEGICYSSGGGGGGASSADQVSLDDTNLAYEADDVQEAFEKVTKSLTYAEYQELTEEEKNNGTIYLITDVNGDGQDFQPVIYSTEEREIGVWTNGKPLYEKTCYSDSPITVSRNSWSGTGITITNVALIAFCSAVAVDGSYQSSLLAYINNNELKLQTPRSSDATVNYITLRYTKTTDQPGSGTWTPQGVPAHHYSTDEQIVGTWIDGSTLYEKTIVVNDMNYPNSGVDYEIGVIPNADELVSIVGTLTNSGKTVKVPLPYSNTNTPPKITNINLAADTKKINFFSTDTWNAADIRVTLRYTKSST